ncbi:DUF397 domain-containing protein [Streptomyces avicenniae]|uniref:DUF397 domain-containing protein n=1 Tax=Streptomyces avicenniae TaxID=500153 RepID=UPI000699F01C|nr:DUF397 domain-containing protein [Streptomyces avicenniae]
MTRHQSRDTAWRTSSYSGGNGDCVAVARYSESDRAVRDSKDLAGPMVTFGVTGWAAFIDWTKNAASA